MSLEARTHLNDRGELVVEQRLTNQSDRKVSFRCQLFAPAQQSQTVDVLDLTPGRDVRTYVLSDGRHAGANALAAGGEIDGPRTLNYRFTAER